MKIRTANEGDLDGAMQIFETARCAMRRLGNDKQWIKGYPQRELILADIRRGEFFVVEGEGGNLCACFSFIIGEEPSYNEIEGAWKSGEPYGTIHRIGSDGMQKGVMPCAVEFCKAKIPHLRIDTHECNSLMRHQIEKCGFEFCGVIYVGPSNPRFAYELCPEPGTKNEPQTAPSAGKNS